MHGIIIGHGTNNQNGRSYTIRVTKTGCAITRMKKHITPTYITAEDCLQIEMTKAYQTLTADILNEMLDQ